MQVIASLIAQDFDVATNTLVRIGDTMRVEAVPAMITFWGFLVLQGALEDYGKAVDAQIVVLDQDGNPGHTTAASRLVFNERPVGSLPTVCLPQKFTLTFPHFGCYLVAFLVNGEAVRHVELVISQA